MDSNHDVTVMALPTPQSSTTSRHEGGHDDHIAARDRGVSAIWSVLQNADIDANSQLDPSKFAIGEKQVQALVSLSGSLLSMLVQYGSESVYEQSMFDLTEFVYSVMDQCDERKQAKELARFLSRHIQGPESTANSPTVDNSTTLITPEEDMEDAIELKVEEEKPVALDSASPAGHRAYCSVYNRPPLTYDPTPIAKIGAQFLSDIFGLYLCPQTVVDYTPTLAEYIVDVLSTARIEISVTTYALALLQKLNMQEIISIPHGNCGLFITAYMIAGKVLCDHPFNNFSWSVIGQRVFTLNQLNEMERIMCADLNWNLHIDINILEHFENGLYDCYANNSLDHATEIDHSPKWAPLSPSKAGPTPLDQETLSSHIRYKIPDMWTTLYESDGRRNEDGSEDNEEDVESEYF